MNEQNEIRGDELADIEESMEREEAHEQAPEAAPLTDEELEDFSRQPQPGTYAHTARMMVDLGMDPDEADRWKDEMKESDLF